MALNAPNSADLGNAIFIDDPSINTVENYTIFAQSLSPFEIGERLKSLEFNQMIHVLVQCKPLRRLMPILIDVVFGPRIYLILENKESKILSKAFKSVKIFKEFLSIGINHKELQIIIGKEWDEFDEFVNEASTTLQASFINIFLDIHDIFISNSVSALKLMNLHSLTLRSIRLKSNSVLNWENHQYLKIIMISDILMIRGKNLHRFPKDITHVHIGMKNQHVTNWCFNFPYDEFKAFNKLQFLVIENTNVHTNNFYGFIVCTPNLKMLVVNFTLIDSLEVCYLPLHLINMDLSNNPFMKTVSFTFKTGWPEGLESIILENCNIDNRGFIILTLHEWPQELKRLNLSGNIEIDMWDQLTNLPPGIESLSIGHNSLKKDFLTTRYPSIPREVKGFLKNVPDKIVEIMLGNYRFTDDYIHFPPSLVTVSLTNVVHLERLRFSNVSENLNSVTLTNSNITNLNLSRFPISHLDLSHNKITTLADVKTPTTLYELYLDDNLIKNFNNVHRFIPYKGIISDRLKTLSLRNNLLFKLERNIQLPSSLINFYLDRNHFQILLIPRTIAFHQHLQEFTFKNNKISLFGFQENGSRGNASKLELFDLTGNALILVYDTNDVDLIRTRIEVGFGRKVKNSDPDLNNKLSFV
ncbi:hypothetical protein DFJ63DRAFT_22066 [Scheffersomyces coipomensis]|uniref:uncharacterized protein n=1 Tax=Scheffersomyces coipomensis TaxID=1788519 RepID=UPI00315CA09A